MAVLSHRRPSQRAARSVLIASIIIALLAATTIAVLLVRSGSQRSLEIGTPVAVGAAPADIEAGDGSIWVSGADDGTLTRIDPSSGATARVAVGGKPGQLIVGDGAVWLRNYPDRVTRVDTTTLAVSPPILTGGGQMGGITVGGGYLWASHRTEATVTRVDTRTLQVTGSPIPVGGGPGPLEYDAGSAFVLNTGDGTMTRLEAATGRATGTVLLGDRLGGVEVDRGVVYVASDGGVVPVSEDTFKAGSPYEFQGWTYFDVFEGTMWIVYNVDPGIQRFDASTREPIGERLPGIGDQMDRARFAYDKLWLTIPERNEVLTVSARP